MQLCVYHLGREGGGFEARVVLRGRCRCGPLEFTQRRCPLDIPYPGVLGSPDTPHLGRLRPAIPFQLGGCAPKPLHLGLRP